MKMRPGTQTGFLLCGKEWSEGEALEVRSPWDQGLVGRVTQASRADAIKFVGNAVTSELGMTSPAAKGRAAPFAPARPGTRVQQPTPQHDPYEGMDMEYDQH